MILTVTPHPAIDLTWHLGTLERGGSHRVQPGASRAGGKGINVARVLHSTGYPVLALTTAGGETGEELRADLAASGIPHEVLGVAASTRRSVAIVETDAAETSILNEHGPALLPGESTALELAAGRRARDADTVVLSGSLPPGFGPERLGALVATLVALAPVIVDTSGPGLLAAASAGAHVLKPNREELAAATGLTDPLDGAHSLLSLGARLVVVSLGAEGLLVVTRDHAPLHARLAAALRGNPTGAGDAAVAAIAVSLAAGDDLWSSSPAGSDARALLARRATAWSAAAVLMPLAGEVDPRHAVLMDDVMITEVEEDTR